MKIEAFTVSSPLYQQSLALRELHLRKPLGLNLSPTDTIGEENHRHFALVDDDTVIGGLIADIQAGHSARFRQMWIDPTHSGSGCGKQLLTFAETALTDAGVRSFFLHARESARGFYLKCGYQPTGTPFTEIGIPHIAMKKTLPA